MYEISMGNTEMIEIYNNALDILTHEFYKIPTVQEFISELKHIDVKNKPDFFMKETINPKQRRNKR